MTARLWPSGTNRAASSARLRAALTLGCFLVAMLVMSAPAHALAFQPSESEWNSWPDFCRARYVVSGAGMDSPFANRVSPGAVKNWELRLGANVWYALHHYCAGLAIEERGKRETDKKKREFALRRANEEYNFTFARLNESEPMRAEIAARMGLVYGELGEQDQALRFFDTAITGCATCDVGYQAEAMYYRTRGDLAAARQVLEAGDKALDGESSQLHYTLGLVLLDLKEFAAAQEQARSAYRLGYPLPGLRDRLAKAGYPP